MRDLEEHRAEVVADFRQYYGLDVPLAGGPDDLARHALLWGQLPRGSRCARLADPDAPWGVSEQLLRSVEYHARLLWWAKTKDAEKGRNAPEPVPLPSERAAEAARDSRAHMDYVARMLGYDPDEV